MPEIIIMAQKTILVVEDEKSLLGAVEIKLEEEGYKVIACSMVDQALEALRNNVEIDAVWLDHYLPEKNGLEVVVFMRQVDSKYKDIPIFLVSNSSSEDKIYQYLHLGVNGYFAKSESRLEDIIKSIEQVLKDNEKHEK